MPCFFTRTIPTCIYTWASNFRGVTYEFAKKAFRIAFARTIFSVQSQAFQGSIAIHDMDNALTTNKHLLTAVSRGTSAELICLK